MRGTDGDVHFPDAEIRYWQLSSTHPDITIFYRREIAQKITPMERLGRAMIRVLLGQGIGRDEVMQWGAGICHQHFMLNDKLRKLAADGYSHPRGNRRGY